MSKENEIYEKKVSYTRLDYENNLDITTELNAQPKI
jgi:hypothetical protein